MSLNTELSEIIMGYMGAYKTTDDTGKAMKLRWEATQAILNYLKDVCNEIIGPDEDVYYWVEELQANDVSSLAMERNQLRAVQRAKLNEALEDKK